MPEYDYSRALEVAIAAAAEATQLLLRECARPDGPRGEPDHCPADDDAEALIRARLLAAFPKWGFLGEESGGQLPIAPENHIWLVDPNDGTRSMQLGFRAHAVAIGLLRDGLPVLGVVQAVDSPDDDGDRIVWAEGCGPLTRNGVPVRRVRWPARLNPHHVIMVSQTADRRPVGYLPPIEPARYRAVSSIAYRLALVASGDATAAVSLNGPSAWDYGAGHALLRGVGGVMVDEHGVEVTYGPDGGGKTRWCFAGGAAVVEHLRKQDWSTVSVRGFGPAAPPPEFEPARLVPGHLIHESARLSRSQGCLLGSLAGDSLGALVKFELPDRIDRDHSQGGPRWLDDGGSQQLAGGQPTGGGELALLLARTLVRDGGFDPEAVAVNYARWLHGWDQDFAPPVDPWQRPFDAGATTRRALQAVTVDDARSGSAARAAAAAADPTSQSSGALVRIGPLGIAGWRRDLNELAEAARADACLTHPHPICQESSALFAVTLAQAIRHGGTPDVVYERAREWAHAHCRQPAVTATLEWAAMMPPPNFAAEQGQVLVALQNAFYRLLHSTSLTDGVVTTVRAGAFADANGAVCVELLGAVHGREALPAQWRRLIITCRPMPGYPHIYQPRPATYWPTDTLVLAERLIGLC
jgi:fructose-1,6-bisphosphatase/inositol monophosphatase family enzyme/ADP-ribosylglycohydrolase